MTAIKAVQDEVPEYADDLYVHTMTADGQYWTVTVGVANVSDYEVMVNEMTGLPLEVTRVFPPRVPGVTGCRYCGRSVAVPDVTDASVCDDATCGRCRSLEDAT